MKTILLLLALAPMASAQALTYGTISTATYSGVTVSTFAATRVDNWNRGVASQMLPNRTRIVLAVPATLKFNCAYSSTISTLPASGVLGAEYSAGVYALELPTSMGYWCMSQAATAGQPLAVQQLSPFKPGTRTIPGSP